MTKLSQRWKSIQGNLALEGHIISDEELEKVAANYEASGGDELMKEVVKISEESGRELFEVFEELLGKKEQKIT